MKADQFAMFNRGPRIGIDPGLSGAIAYVTDDTVLGVLSMPRNCNDQGINGSALLRALSSLDTSGCAPIYVENVGMMNRDRGKLGKSMLAFYESIGALKCVLGMQDRPVTSVGIRSWKSKFGLLSTATQKVPKDAARDVALRVFGASAYRYVRTNTNAADACLIGFVGPMFDAVMANLEPTMHTDPMEDPF